MSITNCAMQIPKLVRSKQMITNSSMISNLHYTNTSSGTTNTPLSISTSFFTTHRFISSTSFANSSISTYKTSMIRLHHYKHHNYYNNKNRSTILQSLLFGRTSPNKRTFYNQCTTTHCTNNNSNIINKTKNYRTTGSLLSSSYHKYMYSRLSLQSQRMIHKSTTNSNTSCRYNKMMKSTKRTKATSTSTTSSTTATSTQNNIATMETMFTNLKNILQHILLQPRIIPIPRWISPRSYSFTLSECFGHASFILVAISYATDDFLLLRIMAVAGSTSMLFFTYFHPHGRVLWLPFQWNLLFIFINTYRIGKSLYYKYISHFLLSEDKKRVRDEYFTIMDTSDFAKLCSIAQEESFKSDEVVVFQGQKNPYIRMVIEGELDVLRDGIKTYALEEGNFITEAGLHAGLFLSGTIESCCTVVAQRQEKIDHGGNSNGDSGKSDENVNDDKQPQPIKARCLRWDRTELIQLLKQDHGLRRSLKAVLSWDIVRKLKAQRQTIAESKVEDPRLWSQKRQEQTEDRYAAILQNMVQNPEYFKKRKSELDHYRRIHHIDDEHHKQALMRCGWTSSEYDAGEKEHENGERDDEEVALL